MKWLREAISDSDGLADMAYISIAGLVGIMVGSVVFLCAMSAVSYARCTEVVDVGQGVRSAIPCKYDPNPLGIAIAACLAAFGSPIGALALYMGQTRRAVNPGKVAPPAGTVTATATVTPAAPIEEGNVKSGRGRPGKPQGVMG
jgi:hypothetical protein